eukprot:2984-Heterococcus_DN1.PRE.3
MRVVTMQCAWHEVCGAVRVCTVAHRPVTKTTRAVAITLFVRSCIPSQSTSAGVLALLRAVVQATTA